MNFLNPSGRSSALGPWVEALGGYNIRASIVTTLFAIVFAYCIADQMKRVNTSLESSGRAQTDLYVVAHEIFYRPLLSTRLGEGKL